MALNNRQDSDSWLSVCGVSEESLAAELSGLVEQRVQAGDYSRDDLKYVEKLRLQVIDGTLGVTSETLEKLRRLCQIADVDIRLREISSHRPVIGPFIVAAKKLGYPVLRALLKDFIRQQRSFNAGVLALLADLANQVEKPQFDAAKTPHLLDNIEHTR